MGRIAWVGLGPGTLELMNGLREFMFRNVYTESTAKSEEPKTKYIIQGLFEHFCKHPELLPAEYGEHERGEPLQRRVADYIAGMTDRYAIKVFTQIHIPQAWSVLD